MLSIRSTAALALAFALACLPTAVLADDAPMYEPDAENPPPSLPLNSFQRFDALPIAMGAPFAGQKGNEIAKERLQANLDLRLQPLLEEWNGAAVEGAARTLRIQPEIRYIRFITGGKRFFAGGLAGASSILLTLKLSDVDSGELIAEPHFYQHANALGAAWSFGATDKTMLIRVSTMISEYLRQNHAQAVGGSISQAPEVDEE